jgi:alanine racemase
MSRPLICEVSIAALRHNFERTCDAANSSVSPTGLSAETCAINRNAKVWSVVKANAYGHGLEAAIVAFSETDGLALVEFDYAARLRKLGWTKPILMLEGAFDLDDTRLARELDLTLVVHQMRQLDWLVETAGTVGSNGVRIWIKLNTGMNRLGFSSDEVPLVIDRLNHFSEATRFQGLMTHFANSDLSSIQSADVAVPLTLQVQRYSQLLAKFQQYWPDVSVSLANSSAVLGYSALADALLTNCGALWVRPGVMLYGATPYADLTLQAASALGLKAAMALKSQIIAVQKIHKGDAIGYGSRFIASTDMTLGIVAGGYADGYPRHAPDGTPVWIIGENGKPGELTRLIGRVSMDMLVIDITQIATAKVGSAIELWGANLPIDDVAKPCGTIGYELMCAVAQRVARKTVSGFLD